MKLAHMMQQLSKFSDSLRKIQSRARDDMPMGRADGFRVNEVRELAKQMT